MPKQDQIDEIMQKIEDIRLFFKMSEEFTPFLSDLFQFLKDMLPLMYDANVSIVESANNLPTASNRINDVNQATEMATQEILDKLEFISTKLDGLTASLPQEKQGEIETIQTDVTDIIFALQFQDITAQKLEHANRILKAIYEKFMTLFETAERMRTTSKVGEKVMDDIQEKSSTYERKLDREKLKQQFTDMVRSEGISQDDIDQYFKGNS